MKALLELARDLIWLRRGPQDLPYSPSLSLALFVAACAADLIVALVAPDGQTNILANVLLSNALMVGLPWAALNVGGMQSRFAQVAGALSLMSIAFTTLIFPILVIASFDGSPADSPSHGVETLLRLILLAWFITVEGHILRHALKLPLALAIVVALTFLITADLVRDFWLGSPQPPVAADAAKTAPADKGKK